MFARKALSLTLALSFGLQPMAAHAGPSSDPMALLAQSARTSDPTERERLAEQARALLESKNLPAAVKARVSSLLTGAPRPSSLPPLVPRNDANSTTEIEAPGEEIGASDNTKSLDAPLRAAAPARLQIDPNAIRAASEEIIRASLEETASTMSERSDVKAYVKEEEKIEQTDFQFGGLAAAVEPFMGDYKAKNKALKEKYEGLPLDEIADKLITDADILSAGAGVAGELIKRLPDIKFLPTKVTGVTVDNTGTFFVNAYLMIRLVDLYGLELDNYNKEVFLLLVLAVTKYGMLAAGKLKPVGEALGRSFARATVGGRDQVSALLGSIMRNKKLGNAPDVEPVAKDQAGRSRQLWEATKKPLGIVASVGWNAAMTHLVGAMTKYALESHRKTEPVLRNRAFRKFLMRSEGEAFMKVLSVAMTASQNKPSLDAIKAGTDPRVQFIRNLSRSTRACSADDRKKLDEVNAGRTVEGLRQDDIKIIRYACDNNLNTARAQRLEDELVTLGGISEDLVPMLRLTGRQNRLRMAEVLLQLQAVDGDRDPLEVSHFSMVREKILGFDKNEDRQYFEKMYGFIRENGGMIPDPAAPTGFSIGRNLGDNPYDLKRGYTSTDGLVEVPAGENFANPE